ncbi:MAG: F0F1 ATP synthase subunit B [Gammaproteobacteria bacterium]|nr:F0F1 ATP synthase subunit B [Gammaproteobacteria bacterium]MBT4494583.1 F0F1 ATP synthase subunit B [Gammaproteobacteria bacterium]
MNINLTMLGQAISFFVFVVFCMKYVWPPLTSIMRERQQTISDGLEKAVAAERQLEQANEAADVELDQAKKQAAELIAQARNRAGQIEEEAKAKASEEAERIIEGAQAEIDQEISRAREELRARVGDLAVEGAEKILESTVDRGAHEAMLSKLAAGL